MMIMLMDNDDSHLLCDTGAIDGRYIGTADLCVSGARGARRRADVNGVGSRLRAISV